MSVRQAQLLFVIGSDEPPAMTRDGRPKYSGCTDLHRLFDKREPVHILSLDRHVLRQRKRPVLEPYRCILNLITDPDQNPRTLDNLKKLLRDYPGKVINRPEAVLRSTRDQVARLLDGIPGLIAPKTIRVRNPKPDLVASAIERAGMRFPLIVRLAGTHTGRIVGLFDTMDDLRAALTEPGEHIITEFVDYRSDDGFYRKYRVFFVGQQRLLRHMIISDAWNVHTQDRSRIMANRPELIAEERAALATPERLFQPAMSETLAQVRQRMALDYFGIDFGIAPTGRLILFEANATMNYKPWVRLPPQFDYLEDFYRPAGLALRELLGAPPWSLPNLSQVKVA